MKFMKPNTFFVLLVILSLISVVIMAGCGSSEDDSSGCGGCNCGLCEKKDQAQTAGTTTASPATTTTTTTPPVTTPPANPPPVNT